MSDLLKQAENRLNKSGFMNLFSSSSKYEDAAELYEKAAIQFKLSKKLVGSRRDVREIDGNVYSNRIESRSRDELCGKR
jgi:hypothetical protein